jgi:hypothetical protein
MAGTLKVDTISENTSAAGVTIDGVLIKDSTSNARLPTAAVLTGATDPIVIATSLVVIARAGAVNATTLAAPTAAQQGTRLTITTGTAYAHTITATSLIHDGVTGGAKTTATFAAYLGASLELVAYNLLWHVVNKNLCTIS